MYTVKPGTQTDTRVRLRGKGVPTTRNKQVRGDHYVTLVVQVPTKMNAEQKELLKAFDQAMDGKKEEETLSEGISQMKARHYEEQGDFKELKRVVLVYSIPSRQFVKWKLLTA